MSHFVIGHGQTFTHPAFTRTEHDDYPMRWIYKGVYVEYARPKFVDLSVTTHLIVNSLPDGAYAVIIGYERIDGTFREIPSRTRFFDADHKEYSYDEYASPMSSAYVNVPSNPASAAGTAATDHYKTREY